MSNSQSSTSSLYLPKSLWLLDEESYEEWVVNITMLLGSKGLDHYLMKADESGPKDTSPDPEDPAKKRMNQMMCEYRSEDQCTQNQLW